MKLHRHQNKGEKNYAEQYFTVFGEKIASENVICQAPEYGGPEKQHKQPVLPAPGSCSDRGHEQWNVCNYRKQWNDCINTHVVAIIA